jgi:hypothetical protein
MFQQLPAVPHYTLLQESTYKHRNPSRNPKFQPIYTQMSSSRHLESVIRNKNDDGGTLGGNKMDPISVCPSNHNRGREIKWSFNVLPGVFVFPEEEGFIVIIIVGFPGRQR